jgi:hypothetical protein
MVFFISPEFSAVGNCWTNEEYERFEEGMRRGQPQMIMEGSAQDSAYSCRSEEVVITAVSSTDASVFPNLTFAVDELGAVVLEAEVMVEWDAESMEGLREAEQRFDECLPLAVGSVTVRRSSGMAGMKEAAIVTRDGKVPLEIRRGFAITAGVFWSGLYHAFRVDAIPLVKVSVIKNSARIDQGLTCVDIGWTCNPKDSGD